MSQPFCGCGSCTLAESGLHWSWSPSATRRALTDVSQTSARPWRAGAIFHGAQWLFRRLVFGFLRLQVDGLGYVPRQSGVIIAGNHPSVLDGVLLFAVSSRPVRFLVAEDLYTHRFLNPFFRLFGCIPVYRTTTHNGDALRAAVAALRAGEVIGIFPEGTIHQLGSMRAIKRGVALLALKTGCPIVPLAIRGSDEAFPDGARVPKPSAVSMRFEAPVAYPISVLDPIPEPEVLGTLEQIRRTILGTMGLAAAQSPGRVPASWIKCLQVALCALIVLPLTCFLTLTSNPSLDPARKAG